jgi:hypothetical protein
MGQQTRPYGRRIQILQLLQEYGALTSSSLHYMLTPNINKRRLRTALNRLEEKNLIYRRTGIGDGISQPAYQLNTRPWARKRIATALKVEPQNIFLPELRFDGSIRLEAQAVWAYRLKQLLAIAHVVSRINYHNDSFAKSVLDLENFERKLLPDMLVAISPNARLSNRICITVDVECNQRHSGWPASNFRLYAQNPLIDGSMLIGSEQEWQWQIAEINKFRWKSGRIKHYSDYFFMFTSNPLYSKSEGLTLLTENKKWVSLNDWLRILEAASTQERNSQESEMRGVPGPSCVL